MEKLPCFEVFSCDSVHWIRYYPNVHVARAGLEPAHLAAQASKTCMSANSITGPIVLTITLAVATKDDNSGRLSHFQAHQGFAQIGHGGMIGRDLVEAQDQIEGFDEVHLVLAEIGIDSSM